MENPRAFARQIAQREAAMEAERAHYTYRQTVTIQEMSDVGILAGEYKETRDVIFSPEGERSEQLVGKPRETLKRLRLTEEDFRDIREIQPLLLTPDHLWNYEIKDRGTDTVDGRELVALEIRPRQILQGQRLFEGTLYIDPHEQAVVRMEGRAVPQILGTKKENLFPSFTTVRTKVGEYWFPSVTFADDTLPFRNGPLRIVMKIEYTNYKRFSAESTIRPQ